MKQLILAAVAAVSLGGCAGYGSFHPVGSVYADAYYTPSGLYCPAGYYCDDTGVRQLISSGNYGYARSSYYAPTYQYNYRYESRQQGGCPSGYYNDGAGCALMPRNGQGDWNAGRHGRGAYPSTGHRDNIHRDRGRPANQSYTPYHYGNGGGSYQEPERRIVERVHQRNDGSGETRVVQRVRERNDNNDRRDRRERRRN